MRCNGWRRLYEAAEDTGHALLLAIVGAALLAGWVVDVARTPANVVIGVGFLLAAALLVLGAMGRLPGRWSHAPWVVLLLAAGAFVWINLI